MCNASSHENGQEKKFYRILNPAPITIKNYLWIISNLWNNSINLYIRAIYSFTGRNNRNLCLRKCELYAVCLAVQAKNKGERLLETTGFPGVSFSLTYGGF